MSTATSVLHTALLADCRTAGVATQAGIAAATWASTTTPRVFVGESGFIGHRNRGRCPFIEVAVGGTSFADDSVEGGMMTTSVMLRCHVAKRDQATARELLGGILFAALAAIRSTTADVYTALGDDSLGEAIAGPYGWQQDATVTIHQTFDRSTYEIL